MDFTFDSEQVALRDAVRDLLRRNTIAHDPGDPVFEPALWAALADLGALGLPFPEEVGGLGAGPIEVLVIAGELGRAGARTPYAEAMLAGTLLAQTEPADDVLGRLIDGSAVVVPALTEPGHAWSLTPAQVRIADGGLTGVREPVPFAAAATHVVTTALGADGELALVVLDDPALGDSGRLDLAGRAVASRTGDITGALRRAVNLATLTVCAEALGAMDAALDLTVDYLTTRKQFGVPLAHFQTLTQRAADMYTSLELARSTVYFAAMSLADNPDDTATISRMKAVLGKTGRHIGQEAIQLHGGIGMTAEYAVGHFTARLTAIEHSYGDTRYHLAALAGRLGEYAAVDLLG